METAHFITLPLEGLQADEFCTSAQFEAYKAAHEGLLSIFEIEESWEVVLGNYRDYERGLADVLISRLTEQSHLDIASDRVRMARLLGNRLSSIKSFQKFSCRVIREANGRTAMASFKEFLQMRRRASLSSRLLDALRNHSQHHSLAVSFHRCVIAFAAFTRAAAPTLCAPTCKRIWMGIEKSAETVGRSPCTPVSSPPIGTVEAALTRDGWHALLEATLGK